MDEPRRVIRGPELTQYVGLEKTQRDELRKRGELFDTYPVYEGGRAKFAYADEVAIWQRWRDARLAGTTTVSHCDGASGGGVGDCGTVAVTWDRSRREEHPILARGANARFTLDCVAKLDEE